jgi:Lipase (class 3)
MLKALLHGASATNQHTAASVLAASCRDYTLRVTGHSLGGGTAVLVTHMLRAQYPTARYTMQYVTLQFQQLLVCVVSALSLCSVNVPNAV